MADQIKATATLAVYQDNKLVANGTNTQTAAFTGSHYLATVQTVGTSFAALNLPNLNNVRFLYLENQSTASVQVSMHPASQSFAVLRTEDILILPPSGSFMTYQVKADLPGCAVLVAATEA